jgi:hypothetical protein
MQAEELPKGSVCSMFDRRKEQPIAEADGWRPAGWGDRASG